MNGPRDNKRAFTLIELLVVIAIIGIVSSAILVTVYRAAESTKGIATGRTKNQMVKAAQLYELDMGFFPPDVNRGWDPGFERSTFWNYDIEQGNSVPGSAQNPNPDCSHCPANWQDIIAQKWNGPYMPWPTSTPWGGLYDYNYWDNNVNRPGGCVVEAGIYAGAQSYYNDNSGGTSVPAEVEEDLIEIGIDDDGCINGESQLLLFKL